MSNKRSYPAIVVPRGATPTEKAMADAMQKLVGQSGNGLDRALTMRDFDKISGFGVRKNAGGLSLDFDNEQNYGLPIKPVGVEVLPTFNTVFLRWNEPDKQNKWYSLTEIWRVRVELEEDGTPYVKGIHDSHNVPAFADAVNVLSVVGNMTTDFVNPGESFVYWVRHVNKSGEPGALHSVSGSLATTYKRPADVLYEYSQEIYAGENYQWLRSSMGMMDAVNRSYESALSEDSGLFNALNNSEDLIDLIAQQSLSDALDKQTKSYEIKSQFSKNYARLNGGIHAAVGLTEAYVNRIHQLEAVWGVGGELDNRIQAKFSQYELALSGPDGALSTKIENYKVSYKGNEVSLQSLASAVANNLGEYEAQWGVKTNVNGLLGGVGFLNDGQSTSFVVNAKTFAVIDKDFIVVPFIVRNGEVVINKTVIDHAEIWDLIAKNIFAENIVATTTFKSPVIEGGSITGVTLNVNDNTIINEHGYLAGVGARLKRLTIVDANDRVVMDSSGVNGTYIKDLSIDTLRIANNAITATSKFTLPKFWIEDYHTVRADTAIITSHQFDKGSTVMVQAVAACVRRSGGGGDDKLTVTVSLYEQNGKLLDRNESVVGLPGDAHSYHFIPVTLIGNTNKNIYLNYIARSHGEDWEVKGWGSVHSAKK